MIKADEIKNKYNESHKRGEFGGPVYTHKWIVDLLRPRKGGRFLDIGCARGLLLKEALNKGLDTYGIDISDEAILEARVNVPKSEVLVHDAERLPYPDRFFDYVTNIGTLEHLIQPENCLREMHRVLKTEGTLCIMLPNTYYYGYILDALRSGKGPTAHQEVERFAARKQWQKMLDDHGFMIARVYKYNKFNKNKVLIFFRKYLIPLNFSHHFVFICKKKEIML